MIKFHRSSNSDAISEVVGGLLLLVIAILAFASIYNFIFPLPEPDTRSNVKLQGYVSASNLIVLEHIGGEQLTSYVIDIKYVNDSIIETISPQGEFKVLDIGDKPYYIPTTVKLNSPDDKLKIIVRKIDENNEIIFEGILQGRTIYHQLVNDSNTPYLISSLLTNTTDEDLICFNQTSTGENINLSFESTSNSYNWQVDGKSIFNALYPFDIEQNDVISDFSNNNNHALTQNVTWTTAGKIGGAYIFDGNNSIELPYCFPGSKIGVLTIEIWIKTSKNDGTIISFNRTDYFSLNVNDKKIKWSATSNGDTIYIIGQKNVSDNQWHHILVTYDQSTGFSSIYVDGIVDAISSDLLPGDLLGSGSQIEGYIGKEKGTINSNEYQTIFSDDFEDDYGWIIDSDGSLTDGEWDRGIPAGLGERGDPPNDYDSSGSGYCYVTDNVRGNSDVDGGGTRLISPSFDWSPYQNINIKYALWYTNDYGNNKNSDQFKVSISNNNGISWTTVNIVGPTTPTPYDWYVYEFQAEDYISFTNQMKIQFEASDNWQGSVVEAGIDDINISAIISNEIKNFTGTIDEVKIYNRVLSEEQIYQNYLLGKSGQSHRSVIVSEETMIGDTWLCEVTPLNPNISANTEESNQIIIKNYGGG